MHNKRLLSILTFFSVIFLAGCSSRSDNIDDSSSKCSAVVQSQLLFGDWTTFKSFCELNYSDGPNSFVVLNPRDFISLTPNSAAPINIYVARERYSDCDDAGYSYPYIGEAVRYYDEEIGNEHEGIANDKEGGYNGVVQSFMVEGRSYPFSSPVKSLEYSFKRLENTEVYYNTKYKIEVYVNGEVVSYYTLKSKLDISRDYALRYLSNLEFVGHEVK